MNKRFRLLFAVIGVGSLSLAAWLACGNREPVYKGRNLTSWLGDLDIESPASCDQAVKAVRFIGTNALPVLNKMVQASDPLWRNALQAFNARQRLIQIPVTPANVTRARAVQGYSTLGMTAQPDVVSLMRLVESKAGADVRLDVITALGAIGPGAMPAIPILLEIAANDPDPELRKSAFIAVANIRRWDRGISERRF